MSFIQNPGADQTPMAKPSIFTGASPKLTFSMGVATGVAAISLVGFALASYGLAGRLPVNRPSAGTSPSVATPNPAIPSPNQPSSPPAKVSIAIKPGDYIRGDTNAPVTAVEYIDLECPFCKRFHPVMKQLLQDYPSKVRWVFRNFPLSFHQNAAKEAEAAECVGKLGGNDKFWAFVDKIFERTTSNGTGFALDKLAPLAGEVGVSQSQFTDCLNSGQFTTKVQTDIQQGTTYGVNGTPTTFVNGQPVEGAVPYEQLKVIVQALLK